MRITNDQVAGDFRETERWIIDRFAESLPHSVASKLVVDYGIMQRNNPHIYAAAAP